jgi:hypothetical protein
MKRYSILLLFVWSTGFGQMTRTIVNNGTCIQYSPASGTGAKSVVIILPGTGEQGTDPTIIETNIKVAGALKAGTFSVNRIILFQQLPKSQGGFYANTIGPLLTYALSFNLPIDFSGLSLGGMGVGLNLPVYPGKFRSAMTCPGKVENNVPADKNGLAVYYDSAYKKLPSIHYYDPADNKILGGYASTKALVTKLLAAGKKDISLIELPGLGHSVWNYAYGISNVSNYWSWLDVLDGVVVTPPPAPTQTHLYINAIDKGVWTDPILSIEVK